MDNPEKWDAVPYNSLGEIMDVIKVFFDALSERVKKTGIEETSIEQWRWDVPVTSLTWVGSDDIRRNINALIQNTTTSYEIMVEANAWQDVREGENLVRHWQHEEVGHLKFLATEKFSKEFYDTLTSGIQMVSSWKSEDLARTKHLPEEVANIIDLHY